MTCSNVHRCSDHTPGKRKLISGSIVIYGFSLGNIITAQGRKRRIGQLTSDTVEAPWGSGEGRGRETRETGIIVSVCDRVNTDGVNAGLLL